MVTSCFYCDESISWKNYKLLFDLYKDSEEKHIQTYVIKSPLILADSKRYDYDKGIAILRSHHRICFLDLDNSNAEFNDYCEDFFDDINYLSEKFEYRPYIGRPRIWRNNLLPLGAIDYLNCSEILQRSYVEDSDVVRKIDCLISLLIGSVNDIDRISGDVPQDVLDAIKRRIILFDCDQTRFIYQKIHKDVVRIQGLAGTGKTELLLHKLKDLFVRDKDSRIVFTCYNKVLAHSMLTRVPNFFNFMHVDEQIKWNERLWVMPSWGSRNNPNSGIYSYICNKYDLPFYTYGALPDFSECCKYALEALESVNDFKPCFDYVLIDEGQDFPLTFVELCKKVSSQRVYWAGDVFQDIYSRYDSETLEVDFLLNKCYRTDPHTLMFAHSVGLGLYENPVIRWLEDDEWKACGYDLTRNSGTVELTRVPLKRFDDNVGEDIESVKIIVSPRNQLANEIINIISDIKEQYLNVRPKDIAIVFVETNLQRNYELADYLEYLIPETFEGWSVVKGYEVKDSSSDSIYISNRNNVKGLEFPFVICLANGNISRNISVRNTLYMTMTRSFITTYFLVNEDTNSNFIGLYQNACNYIKSEGKMVLREPSSEEKQIQNKIVMEFRETKRPVKDIVESILELPEYSNLDFAKVNNIADYVSDYLVQYIEDNEEMDNLAIEQKARKMIDSAI